MSIKDEVLKEVLLRVPAPTHKFWDICKCSDCAEYRNKRTMIEDTCNLTLAKARELVEDIRQVLVHKSYYGLPQGVLRSLSIQEIEEEIQKLLAELDAASLPKPEEGGQE